MSSAYRARKGGLKSKKDIDKELSKGQMEMLNKFGDKDFHYLGPAQIIGLIGKGFADAMIALDKKVVRYHL